MITLDYFTHNLMLIKSYISFCLYNARYSKYYNGISKYFVLFYIDYYSIHDVMKILINLVLIPVSIYVQIHFAIVYVPMKFFFRTLIIQLHNSFNLHLLICPENDISVIQFFLIDVLHTH